MTRFVQTSKNSAFGGLILPESHVEDMLRNIVAGPGAYTSAQRNNKNTANWRPSNGSADSDTLFDKSTIQNQARDLVRNNPIASGAINNATTNVVGSGLRARSRINYEYLGITYEKAAEIQKKLDFYFHVWASSKNADITKTQNFYESMDLVLSSCLVSGDVGILRRYKPTPGWTLSTAFQIIEADRISTPTLNPNRNIRAGVELDQDGAPVAYHISKNHPGETWHPDLTVRSQDWTRVPAFDESGRRMFLHVFRRLRPDQTRGVSYLAPIIEPLKQLGRYTEAEVTAAVVSACFSVFIKSDAPSGINGSLIGSMPGVVGDTQVTPKGTGLTQLESGMIADLAPGESIEVADPKRPNTAFDPFVLSMIRQMGMSLEQPYETLIKHYSSSFTAARAAFLDLWRFVKKIRSWYISQYCNPVREWVITELVADGLIDLKDFFDDPFAREAWLNCVWSGPTMGHINPSVEADAEQKWMGMGVKSLDQVSMETEGNQWEETADQIERERKRYIKMPVLPNPNLVTQPVDPSQKSPEKPQPLQSDENENNKNGGEDNAS